MRQLAIGVMLLVGCGDNKAGPPDAPVDIRRSVLELHGSPTRAGAYVAPNLTHAAAAGMHIDPTFDVAYAGAAYAQPLFYDVGGAGDLFVVATEQNEVIAARTDGTIVWQRVLGDPQRMPNDAEGAPCGNIDPLGITGTPVIDYASRTLFLDAMVHEADHAHHRIFALSLDDGTTLPDWPVDVGTAVTNAQVPFTPATQNQRGGLTYRHGRVYVPYGGHAGDCGDYHGWMVSVPRTDPRHPKGFATVDRFSGSWTPGGASGDGAAVYAVFGNGEGKESWGNSEMVARFGDDAAFSGSPKDFWVPPNWRDLDGGDVDITGPPLVLDLDGATPSALLIVTGKDGMIYLVDRTTMGGITDPVASIRAVTNEIISVSAVYRTKLATYVVFRGHGVNGCPGLTAGSALAAVRIEPGAPPTLSLAWCAAAGNFGSPIATTTDGTSEPIVWSIGTEGDQRLHGFDGDTGAEIFAGGGPGDAVTKTSRFITPIVAKGRILVATDGKLVAWTNE